MAHAAEVSDGDRPSQFTWGSIGDLLEGRPTLGFDMPVLVYRLFQYTLKDVLAREVGREKTAELFQAAGHLAGLYFAQNLLDLSGDFDYFIANLQRSLLDLKIGVLRVEGADLASFAFTLTVAEDLDCSGLPVTGETVCSYDEGFIAGIFEAYCGRPFLVREIDCWASGGRVCRFNVRPR